MCRTRCTGSPTREASCSAPPRTSRGRDRSCRPWARRAVRSARRRPPERARDRHRPEPQRRHRAASRRRRPRPRRGPRRADRTVHSSHVRGTVPWTWLLRPRRNGRDRQVVLRPAPRPVAAVLTQAGPDGVVEDVFDCRLEVVFVPDDPAAEPLLVQMAFSHPALVEALGVHAGQPVHPDRYARELCLDQEVEVRAHQAPRVELPVELGDDAPEQHAEPVAVDVVEEHVTRGHAFRRHMEGAVLGESRSRATGHRERP